MARPTGAARDWVGPAWVVLVITWVLGSSAYALVQAVRIRRMVLLARRGRAADVSLTHRVAQMALVA